MAETKVAMWRSVRKEDFASVLTPEGMPVKGVLYPDFERRLITGGKRKGQYRPPDVTTFVDEVEGVNVRFVRSGGGTSLFDKKDAFGTAYWRCFEIPAGTEIDGALLLKGPDPSAAVPDADHYQIEPRARIMTVEAYKGALDNFARAAVARSVELAK